MDIKRSIPRLLIGLLFGAFVVLGGGVARASETVGTIDSTLKYAWSNQIGWINFGATNGSISITDTGITGYAWSPYFGWINFAPSGSGVTNAGGLGVLGGHAWGQNTGFISFTGVTINSSGQFTGTATGTIVGTLTFDCTNCSVKTDWRPVGSRSSSASTATVSAGGGGSVGGGFGFSAPAIPPPQTATVTIPPTVVPVVQPAAVVSSISVPSVPRTSAPSPVTTQAVPPVAIPEIIPVEQAPGEQVPDAPCTEAPATSNSAILQTGVGQAGILTEQLIGDKVVTLSVPCTGAELVYAVSEKPLAVEDVPAIEAQIVGGFIYEITAIDAEGGQAHSFAKEIKIRIAIPAWVPQSGNEAVYYLDEVANSWIGIPSAIFGDGFVEFTVDHLTKFAIIRTESKPSAIPAVRVASGATLEIDSKLRSQTVGSAQELFVESRFNNTGPETVAAGFEAQIIGSDGSVKAQIAEEVIVVRQQSQSRQFANLELAPGTYTLKTTVRFKDGTRKNFEETFVVRGSESQIFLVVGASLGALLLVVLVRFALRKRTPAVPLAQ